MEELFKDQFGRSIYRDDTILFSIADDIIEAGKVISRTAQRLKVVVLTYSLGEDTLDLIYVKPSKFRVVKVPPEVVRGLAHHSYEYIKNNKRIARGGEWPD